MKQMYMNFVIMAISLCCISLSAQTSAEKTKAPSPVYGKQMQEKLLKEMTKPKMPATRTYKNPRQLTSANSASLRATTEALKVDSIISFDNNGGKKL